MHADFPEPVIGGMCLLVVDAESKWIEVNNYCISNCSGVQAFIRHSWFTREIVTDNGPQFIAREMKDFLKSNGILHVLSSRYHPASNGEAEHAMRTFKEAMKIMNGESGSVSEKVSHFLLSYRSTPHTATDSTPAELLMGRRMRTRLDLLHPSLSARMSEKSKSADHSTPRIMETGEPVMVRDYRNRTTPWIQSVIQDRLAPVTYGVLVGKLLWK